MSSLKKRNIVFYDKRREEGDLTVDIPSTDYIKKTFGVKLSASDVILDPGCGVCSHLLSLNCGEKVGLDISLGNLTVAKNRSKKLHLIRGDVESLPFKDRAFDAILIVSLLHHIPNPETALNEVGRICRETSRLFICDSSITGVKLIYPLALVIQYLGKLLGGPESFGPTFDKLHSVLKANNFGIVRRQVSITFIIYLYISFKAFAHRLRDLPLGTKLYELVKSQETFVRSLDARAFSKIGERFGVWFNLFAIKK